ncbi:hypothetical protein HMPREF1990_01591 [Porphyromonas gingivalis W4087]|nr:hypothetical protein HMPREF1554_01237 [Porphyromonas gingivalis F0569]ERJ87926.1 hypothetical protein HMPREF1990_01591 [Porphyromonas gingivalis W4087]
MKLQCCNIDLGVKLIGNGPMFLHNYYFFFDLLKPHFSVPVTLSDCPLHQHK